MGHCGRNGQGLRKDEKEKEKKKPSSSFLKGRQTVAVANTYTKMLCPADALHTHTGRQAGRQTCAVRHKL